MRIIRNNKRLPPESYVGKCNLAITANERDRKPIFEDPNIVSTFVELLKNSSSLYDSTVPIYCFMPDHLHMLVKGMSETANAKLAVDKFKYLSGSWLKRHRPDFNWQGGYFDHIIGPGDDWRNQAFYFFNNPVRKGLVEDPYDYPYSGSIGYDLSKLLYDLGD